MTLENFVGNLKDTYKQLQPGTMRCVDQLMNERRDNVELRNLSFYTADGVMYFLDGVSKTPTLAITREAQNPVLQNIDDAFGQLLNNRNYHVLQADFEQALAAPDTVLVALPALRLQGNGAEWRYLEIGTTPAKYAKLNEEEQKFAERVYGRGDNFAQNMEMLKKARISETRIFVLKPGYVQKHAKTDAIARASWLRDFDINSYFNAGVRNVNIRYRVRGVRREVVAEAFRQERHERSDLSGAQKNLGHVQTPAPNLFRLYLNTILADEENAVKTLDDKTAAGLAGLMQAYLAARGK